MRKRQLGQRPFFSDLPHYPARHAIGRTDNQHEMRYATIHPPLQLLCQPFRRMLAPLYKQTDDATSL